MRLPRRVQSVRPLSRREMAEINPLAHSLVSLTNLLRMPRTRRRVVRVPVGAV